MHTPPANTCIFSPRIRRQQQADHQVVRKSKNAVIPHLEGVDAQLRSTYKAEATGTYRGTRWHILPSIIDRSQVFSLAVLVDHCSFATHITRSIQIFPSTIMSTITSIASLTVRELPLQPTSPSNYSFVEALSDAGVRMTRDLDPQARGRPPHEHNIVYLWEAGCRMNDTWDCQVSCMNSSARAKMVWGSPDAMFTLQNCLIFPILEYTSAKDWLIQDPPGLLEKYGIMPNSGVSIGDDKKQAQDFWPAIRDCRSAMCSDLFEGKGCPADNNATYHATPVMHAVGSSGSLWQPHLVC